MFLLTNTFEDKFQYGDCELHVDMSFDNILRLFEMFDDPYFQSFEKVLIALEILIVEYELIKDLGYMQQFELYKYVMQEFLDMSEDDEEKDKESEGNKDASNERVMDFQQDAGLIYASFLSEFGIDLFEQQGKLHWHKFSKLLSNLGEDTAFSKVVGYRTMKVPTSKQASKEQREHIRKMKKLYNLDDEEDKQIDASNKLDAVASTFARGGNVEGD